MKILSIDVETFSSVDLLKCGVYKYAESLDFEILLFGYAYDDGPVQVIDLASGEHMWETLLDDIKNPNVIKRAFNANFERTCIRNHFGIEVPPEGWECTSVHSLVMGLPMSLGEVAKAMRIQEQKDAAGKNLIKYFSMPCKPTKVNGGRTRNLPEHDPEQWAKFKAYCAQDVEVERTIKKAIEKFPLRPEEQKLWELDQRINDQGVMVDMGLVQNAIEGDLAHQERLTQEAVILTGLDNPGSVAQLKRWLEEAEGLAVSSLSKDTVPGLLKQVESATTKRVLGIRQELAKTSVKKYQAMERSVCHDEHIRGLLQFYGANRTGRWAGRLVQVHNLPQNKIPDLELARNTVKDKDFEMIELLFESVPVVLSQLIRTALVPKRNHRFVIADFSAIEARVIAWMADESWRMEVFQTHGKIYEASASQMFRVPIETITKGNPLRQKGKISELALGYGGGKGALLQMGALNMGLTEEELPGLVTAWRKANPGIVKFWSAVENAAAIAVRERTTVKLQHGITFLYQSGILFAQLPSGRRLSYVRPMLEKGKFGGDMLTYEGYEQGKWGRLSTYGGKLVENLTQAVARDCLAVSMLRLDAAGYRIAFHVHDEVICEVPNEETAAEMSEIMSRSIEWAKGLPLKAEAFETQYYMKEG